MKRKFLLFGGLLAALVGFALWNEFRPIEGVETMGPEKAYLAWVGLATSVTGLATSVVTLVATVRKQ